MTTTRRNAIHGPTTKTVAENVRRLRQARGLSVPKLSAKTDELGYEVPAEAIHKIEAAGGDGRPGARRVNVDELMVLAIALGTSPNALLLPVEAEREESVGITGTPDPVEAERAWRWGLGEYPLPCHATRQQAARFPAATNPWWVLALRETG